MYEQVTRLIAENTRKLEQITAALDGNQHPITVDEIRRAVQRADIETDKAVASAQDRAIADVDWQPMDDAYDTLESNAYLWISFLLDELDKREANPAPNPEGGAR